MGTETAQQLELNKDKGKNSSTDGIKQRWEQKHSSKAGIKQRQGKKIAQQMELNKDGNRNTAQSCN